MNANTPLPTILVNVRRTPVGPEATRVVDRLAGERPGTPAAGGTAVTAREADYWNAVGAAGLAVAVAVGAAGILAGAAVAGPAFGLVAGLAVVAAA